MVAMKTGKTIFQFIIEMVAKRKKGFIKNTNLIGTYYHWKIEMPSVYFSVYDVNVYGSALS